HCDHECELEQGAEQRCPKCMRVHGLRKLDDAEKPAAAVAKPAARSRLVTLACVLVAIAGAGGYALWKRNQSLDPQALERTPLSEDELKRELERRGVDPGALLSFLAPDAALTRFAERAAQGHSTAEDKARAVVTALRARATSHAFVPGSMTDPRVDPPLLSAAKASAAISKDDARLELYPLELAALAVAALRAVQVPAMVAEVHAFPDARGPLDPSGRLGYFGLALPAASGKPRLLDVYGTRAEQAVCSDCALRSDLQVLGAALSLQALQRLTHNEDPASALHDADAAVKLLPESATVRSARGTVLLSNGATELGQSELEAAAQMQPDAPRRNNLAMVYLALGDGERAAREVAQVLEQQPDFALGHATLAEIHISRGERDLAQAELDKARELDPGLPSLPLTLAQFYAAGGQNEQAIEQAQRAVRARPIDPQARIVLARIYRQAGRYPEMREQAHEVLALAPAPLADRTRELLQRLLGPTVLDTEPAAGTSPEQEPAAPEAEPKGATPEPGRLDLSQALSGDRAHPSLLGSPSGPPSAGTLQPGGGAPRLKLGQSGKKLELR
ncbi:MAG: tetratricopeptide repeat protein, partial [Polyangiales bacterium]